MNPHDYGARLRDLLLKVQYIDPMVVPSYCDIDKIEFNNNECPICRSTINMKILGDKKEYGTDWLLEAYIRQNLPESSLSELEEMFEDYLTENDLNPECLGYSFESAGEFLRALDSYEQAREDWMYGKDGNYFAIGGDSYSIYDLEGLVNMLEKKCLNLGLPIQFEQKKDDNETMLKHMERFGNIFYNPINYSISMAGPETFSVGITSQDTRAGDIVTVNTNVRNSFNWNVSSDNLTEETRPVRNET